MKKIINLRQKSIKGATVIEWALLAALISVSIIGVLVTLDTKIMEWLS